MEWIAPCAQLMYNILNPRVAAAAGIHFITLFSITTPHIEPWDSLLTWCQQVIHFYLKLVMDVQKQTKQAPQDRDSPSDLMMSHPPFSSFAVFVLCLCCVHLLKKGTVPYVTTWLKVHTSPVKYPGHTSVCARERGGLMTNESHMFPIRSPRFGSF